MPTVAIWSASDFGTSSYVFGGTFTMTGTPDVAEFSDDDEFFHDGPRDFGTPDETGADQILTTDLIVDGETVGVAGDPIYNAAEATVINNTTGETGKLLFVTVGDGGQGTGFVGYASTIYINPGDSFTISNVDVSSQNVIEAYTDIVPCFVRGTPILTDKGERPIEALRKGDLIVTKDSVLQPIRWIGSTRVHADDRFAPVVISAGAMGNSIELRVSPQHRLLIEGWKVELNLGVSEALIPAKHLTMNEGIYIEAGGSVEYFHILFDQHEIIYSAGIPSESFYPGAQSIHALDEDQRTEILTLFPELAHSSTNFGLEARTSVKAHEARAVFG
ncbi:Hint domain-containing protein [Celeribacter halophilus]|uniref:Hint domain-containing protein n=1 Tax=Celeribacter halophilus TaxID=576117 RepID=UPI001C084CBD|nr:Hint domain-containing protein [Celeribacter halophilus]MBU2888896.1 Hint domain-containing protein [Celeribacter halophilus]MDO6512014.1 Hint domain-containing protein [Celeribacter halophilus]